MPWEDCYFARTDDNRFINTNCNRWFGIKDETERDFSSKGMAVGAVRREIGGVGMGFGKRPYLHTDYHEMLKSTTDYEAFNRMAASGYFPGRSLLERPYGSRDYQEMKYQKPVAPLMAETPPELKIERPEFEIPMIPSMETPMWIHGYVCLTNVSRLKVCLVDDGTAEGIEIYDGISARYTKEALLTTSKRFNILVYNIYQVRQTSPYIYIFVHDGNSWRKCTSTECGGRICDKIEVIPGKEVWAKHDCWMAYFDDNYWESGTYGVWDALENRWEAEPYQNFYGIALLALPTWVEDYRPEKVKITFTGVATLQCIMYDTEGFPWFLIGDDAITSGKELTINWQGYDIYTLTVKSYGESVFYVTNIEFSL